MVGCCCEVVWPLGRLVVMLAECISVDVNSRESMQCVTSRVEWSWRVTGNIKVHDRIIITF